MTAKSCGSSIRIWSLFNAGFVLPRINGDYDDFQDFIFSDLKRLAKIKADTILASIFANLFKSKKIKKIKS